MGKRVVLRRTTALLATAVGTALLASCADSGSNGPPPPYAQYAERCVSPRSGTSDVQGTLTDEKNWLRTWSDDLYLWYSEIPPSDPNAYATPENYFAVLKTPLLTASGNPKDKFHFTQSTAEWTAFVQNGVVLSYGVDFVVVAASPPRELRIGYVNQGGPGANAGLKRGSLITKIDGAAVVDGNKDVLNAGLGPTSGSPTHSFEYQLPGQTTTQTVTLTAVDVTTNPVPVVQVFQGSSPGTSFGYILFNDHIATSEDKLFNAINLLRGPPQITELVLDMRYNGGGILAIASELAYMISGPGTGGRVFETLQFNDKHPTVDPVAGVPITPTPFITISQGYTSVRKFLPTLGLKRVFVLTGPGTCSASEAVMNGLRGVDVDVVQIGATTCGKPYGFYATDNCATTYFSIQFQGVNAKGFGGYSDGFVPGGTGTGVAGLPGCPMNEDFAHELGDPADARVVAATNWAANPGTCPPPPTSSVAPQAKTALSAAASDQAIHAKPPWRENRIVLRDGSTSY